MEGLLSWSSPRRYIREALKICRKAKMRMRSEWPSVPRQSISTNTLFQCKAPSNTFGLSALEAENALPVFFETPGEIAKQLFGLACPVLFPRYSRWDQ